VTGYWVRKNETEFLDIALLILFKKEMSVGWPETFSGSTLIYLHQDFAEQSQLRLFSYKRQMPSMHGYDYEICEAWSFRQQKNWLPHICVL
jgi:hypothetical protein